MTGTIDRPVAVITGASGGMGSACCRLLGATMDLVLADVDGENLQALRDSLELDGYTVLKTVPGSLTDSQIPAELVAALETSAQLGALIHTAGLPPICGDWRRIIDVNLVATETILDNVEPFLTSGSVAVLIASIAGHTYRGDEVLDTALRSPFEVGLHGKIEPMLTALICPEGPRDINSAAYYASKAAVIAIAERRAAAWAEKGARIVSISPGTIWTPMLRNELVANPVVNRIQQSTPLRRFGTAMDIAQAVKFLVSDEATFITGCDLKIDGGYIAAHPQ